MKKFAGNFWSFWDGKKTVTGLVFIFIGIFLRKISILSEFSHDFLNFGISMFLIGLGFKIKKGKNDKLINFAANLLIKFKKGAK